MQKGRGHNHRRRRHKACGVGESNRATKARKPCGIKNPMSGMFHKANDAQTRATRGRTTTAVAHAKLRKRDRVPTTPSSVADTLAFIKGCVNLDPDHAGAMMARANGTKDDIAAAVAVAKKGNASSVTTSSHLSKPEKYTYAPDPPKMSGGSVVEFGTPSPASKPNLPDSKSPTGEVDWEAEVQSLIKAYERVAGTMSDAYARMPGESAFDYYNYLKSKGIG